MHAEFVDMVFSYGIISYIYYTASLVEGDCRSLAARRFLYNDLYTKSNWFFVGHFAEAFSVDYEN